MAVKVWLVVVVGWVEGWLGNEALSFFLLFSSFLASFGEEGGGEG